MKQYILKREHISAELHNLFDYPLTVAVSAMGYGKTTSARDFLNEVCSKYIWLSIESDESSPQYLWDSLTRQLTKTNSGLGQQLRAIGFPTDSFQRDKVINIIEDYTYRTDTVLVIDDYHFAHSPELDKLIEQIVRTCIEGFHILILSRTIPNMRIDEFILKGYCSLIKSHLFEVSADEIKKFFELYGHSISNEIAKQVHEISEGWISAVYLIMQRYVEIGRLEPGRSIVRLIETAVMSRYTDKEIAMLKSLSVLDGFAPQQAVYVTEDIQAERVIQNLSLENSFIRYDERGGVYRIHNIFNNYLRQLLSEQPGHIDEANLYKRSGQWCIDYGDVLLGLKYLLKAKEYDLILKEFEKRRMVGLIDSNPQFILELFGAIPVEVRYRYPIAYIAYIGFYVTNVDQENGAILLKEIEEYYLNDEKITDVMKRRITGEIELIRAYISFNDVSRMHEKLKKAHALLEGHSLVASKDKIITFGSPHILYLYCRNKGKMLWTLERLEELFPYYMELAGGCGIGFDLQLRAEYCLETGRLEEAELYAFKAMYKARTLEQISVIICSNLTLARISMARGKYNEAIDIMDALGAEVEDRNSPILSSAFDLSAGYIGGITGQESGFAKWLRSGDVKQSEVLYQGMGLNYIVYGQYLLLKEDYIQLEVLCEEMYRIFSKFNNQIGFLHAYILDAAAKYRLYGMEKAKKSIQCAIEIGKADDILLPFGEYGLYILEILQNLQGDYKTDEYQNRIVAYALQYSDKLKQMKGAKSQEPLLTKREKETLQLVVEGKTNREIAAELFIAEVTVRKNITAIYRKLDVTGRASAVKKAMEQRII